MSELADTIAAIDSMLADLPDLPVTAPSNAERPCAWCGGEVTGRADKRYCSGACRVADHRKQHRPTVRRWPDADCVWCFEPYPQTRPDQRYCTVACKQAAYRDRVIDREMTEALISFGPALERLAADL